VLAGTRAWIAIPERQAGRIPYVCGLAIQLGVVAVARRRDSSIDAFAFWKGLGASAAPYHEAAAVQFLQRSGAAEESALLGRMFTDKDTPFVESLRQLYAAAGLATRAGGALPARLRPAIAGKLLIAIMGEDCSGSYGFFRQDDYFLTQESKSCKSFGAPMKVRYVAGRDLLNAPFEAIAAAREACADAKSVTLRSVDGSEIAPACSEATLGGVATPESVIALEEAPVVAVLKASR